MFAFFYFLFFIFYIINQRKELLLKDRLDVLKIIMSRNKNITLLALLVFCLFVSLFSFYALKSIKTQHAKNIQHSLQTVLLSLEQTHQLIITQRKISLENIATNTEIINKTKALLALKNQNANLSFNSPLSEIRNTLTPVLKQFDNTSFYVISPDNINIAADINKNLGKNNVVNHYFPDKLARALSGETIVTPVMPSEIQASSLDGLYLDCVLAMFILTPIYDGNGKIIATLALNIDPIKYYTNIAKLGRIGDSGETYFFNNKALLLSQSRFDHQLRELNLIKNGQDSASHIRIVDPGGNLLVGYKPEISLDNAPLTLMARQATQKKSDYNLSGYRDYRGVKVIGAWTWNNEFEFGLTTEIDFDEAYKAYYHTSTVFILVILFSCAMGIVITLKLANYKDKVKKQLLTYNTKLESKVNERTHEFEQAKERLYLANQELSILANTDGLTGLSNRRYFDDEFNKELARAKENNYQLGLIMLDIDYFKQYNDYYGHLMGDECLTIVANLLKSINPDKRASDIIARFGGEEFIILVVNADRKHVEKTAQRIHSEIEKLEIHHKTSPLSNKTISISIGFTVANGKSIVSENTFIKQADQALYRAKSSGRNRVIDYKSLNISEEEHHTSIIVPFEKQK